MELWAQCGVGRLRICLFILILAGFLWGAPATQALSEDQQLVLEAWSLVNQSYVDPEFEGIPWRRLRQEALERPIPSMERAYEAIETMLVPLGDPFTRFLRPEQFKALTDSTAGSISGVGLQLGINEGETVVRVLSSLEGSPAAAAGIQPGSVVLAVEGNSVEDLGLEGVSAALRGPSGTIVDFDLEAPDGGRQSLSLKAAHCGFTPRAQPPPPGRWAHLRPVAGQTVYNKGAGVSGHGIDRVAKQVHRRTDS